MPRPHRETCSLSHRGHFADQMLDGSYIVHEEHILVHHRKVRELIHAHGGGSDIAGDTNRREQDMKKMEEVRSKA